MSKTKKKTDPIIFPFLTIFIKSIFNKENIEKQPTI